MSASKRFQIIPWFVKAAFITAYFSVPNISALHTKTSYFFNFSRQTHTLLKFETLAPPFFSSQLQLLISSRMVKMHDSRCTDQMQINKSYEPLCLRIQSFALLPNMIPNSSTCFITYSVNLVPTKCPPCSLQLQICLTYGKLKHTIVPPKTVSIENTFAS